ncbi:hypothetical protein DFS33DRAFT_1075127 [Desarmillaria ectypa]|nr:hypothetical protein DFS33DRAFT_1075127 [Desarmillaria ectypa]
MDPSAVLIVDNKVRFVDNALKRWFSPNILIYDRTIHDEQQLGQARQAHWKQVELLFERLNVRPGTGNRYRSCEYRLLNVISIPRMSLVTFSLCPSVGHQRRKKRKQRSSEPQMSPDAACDGEYLPGRDGTTLTRRPRIALIQREYFGRRPVPYMINSETSLSSLSPPSSRILYSVPDAPHDASSPAARHGGIPRHRRIFYSNHSSPSPSCDRDILESSWLEEIKS